LVVTNAHGTIAEIFTKKQFVAWLELEHLGRSPAQHNPEKLLWLNHHYIQQADTKYLSELVRPFAEERGIDIQRGPNFEQVVGLLKDRANTLLEIADGAKLFYAPAPQHSAEQIAAHIPAAIKPALKDLKRAIEGCEASKEAYAAVIKTILAEHQIKMPALAMPLRFALFATTQTPAIDAVMALMGWEACTERLNLVLSQAPS